MGQGSWEGKEHRRELPLGGLREAWLQAEGGLCFRALAPRALIP